MSTIYQPIPISAAPPTMGTTILVEIDGRAEFVQYYGEDTEGKILLFWKGEVLQVSPDTEWGQRAVLETEPVPAERFYTGPIPPARCECGDLIDGDPAQTLCPDCLPALFIESCEMDEARRLQDRRQDAIEMELYRWNGYT